MPNQIAENKKKYNFVLEKSLISQIDNECQRTGLNRTETVKKAIREHLKLDPVPASNEQIQVINSKLDTLEHNISKGFNIINEQNKQLGEQAQVKNLLEDKKPKKKWYKKLFS